MEDSRILNAPEESKCRKLLQLLNSNDSRLDLSELSGLRTILNTDTVDVLDYPHAISKFIEACNGKIELDPTFPTQEVAINMLISELYCNINQKQIAKNTFEEYLAYIIGISEKALLAQISLNCNNAIASKFEEFQQRLLLFTLPYSEIKQNFYEIILEDLFYEALCYTAVKIHSQHFLSEFNNATSDFIQNLKFISSHFSSHLCNRDIPAHLKIIYRTSVLDGFFKYQSNFIIDFEILRIAPPSLIPPEGLILFEEITLSNIFNQALTVFLSDTLTSDSQAFPNLDEGKKMFKSIIELVMAGHCAYYAPLKKCHGKSSCNFMFIKEEYRFPEHLDQCMRLLTIIHECAHMYKRNNNGKNRQKFSPQTVIKYENRIEMMSEDGFRLENGIFGMIYGKIYTSTAKFIIMRSSWNLELQEFRSRVAECQQIGESKNECYISQRKDENYAEWPTLRCEGRVNKFWG